MDYKTLYKESITNKEEFWKKQAERIVWDEEPTHFCKGNFLKDWL